jgi:hypothetical protein
MKEGGGHGKSLSGFSCLAIMRQTPDKFPICAGARSAELVHNAGILGVQLINADEVFGTHRALFILMTKLWPSLLGAAQVVQPETILRWRRADFKVFWRWKSRKRTGRPKINRGLRDLIQRMSRENPRWGASRIHAELLMLGFEVAQSTVSKYMVRPATLPSQTWKTFLRNHAEAIAAIDMCVVPTLTFDRLFAFLVLGHGGPNASPFWIMLLRSSGEFEHRMIRAALLSAGHAKMLRGPISASGQS